MHRIAQNQPLDPRWECRRHRRGLCAVVLLAVALASQTRATAAKRKPTTTKPVIANGKPCVAVGTTAVAAGASYGCVVLRNKALQWWRVGTAQNPLRLGQTGRVSSVVSGNWEITVLKRIDDDTARILAIDAKNHVAIAGNIIASVEVRAKNIGPEFSIRATGFEAATVSKERIGRWELGQPAPEDCWNNERLAAGAEKVCQYPFEIAPGDLQELRLAVRPGFGTEAPLFFDTALNQPPLR
jgi:hypothetical protein